MKLDCGPRRTGASPISLIGVFVLLAACPLLLQASKKDKISYGEGLIVNVPFPEAEVEQVVQDITQNGIIRGTKEYNKDEYVGGAKPADSTRAFPEWTEGGKVFYKVRLQAIDPRNFKDGGDVGTLAVRYVLQPQGDKNTVLRINAVFVEDFRRIVHASDGSVEGSEFKDIRDHLDSIELMRSQTVEAEKEREQQLLKKQAPGMTGGSSSSRPSPAAGDETANNSVPSSASVRESTGGHNSRRSGTLCKARNKTCDRNRNSFQPRTGVKLWSSMFRICAAGWSAW